MSYSGRQQNLTSESLHDDPFGWVSLFTHHPPFNVSQ